MFLIQTSVTLKNFSTLLYLWSAHPMHIAQCRVQQPKINAHKRNNLNNSHFSDSSTHGCHVTRTDIVTTLTRPSR